MSEILEMALSKQEPAQAKIRERMMKENLRRESEPHTELRLVA